MKRRWLSVIVCGISIAMVFTSIAAAQNAKAKPKKKNRAPFKWVNQLPQGKFPQLLHKTFRSPSMNIDVGYCIYLPPQYKNPQDNNRRFPVVYYLHGGRPGSEIKSAGLSTDIHDAISTGKVPPAIYLFVNGGAVSHYNYPQKNSMGEDVFIKELIPHIDKTYRTVADRSGRALEGFSQGGRGTTRIMFKHPHLFCSAAPGGAGHATEKRISEENGRESEALIFAKGYNTYDLARKYAQARKQATDTIPPLNILIFVGDQGFNYKNNLAYMEFLRELKIPFKHMIISDAPHSAKIIYKKRGLEIMNFHAANFKKAAN